MSAGGEESESVLGGGLSPVANGFTLKEQVYRVLREAIMQMDIYAEGVDLRLDERQLSERLGISRTPIREALSRLEQDGFVEIVPRKGVFVRPKTLEEVLEMIVVWAALESMAARLAADVADDHEIASLRDLGTRHDEHDGLAEYSEANIRFHQRILELSRCSLLKVSADNLLQHMHAVRRRAMGEGDRFDRSVTDHVGIIEAIENRDGDLAARLVREHTMRLHDHVCEVWCESEDGRPAVPPPLPPHRHAEPGAGIADRGARPGGGA